jgi:type IV pilus assembly protein PilW
MSVPASDTNARRQRGLGLVELMVAILVGMLVVLAATGSLFFFEGQRRTSLSSNAAMNAGVMGAFMLQRDLRNAGMGLIYGNQVACTRLNLYHDGAVRADGAPAAPVRIADGGAGPDALTVLFTQSVLGAAPAALTRGLASGTQEFPVNASAGLDVGDVVIVAGISAADPCTVAQISGVASAGSERLLAHGAGGEYRFNAPDPATAFAVAPLYPAGSVLMKTGRGLTWRRYEVLNGDVVATDVVTGAQAQVASNATSLQAQYGVTDGFSDEVRQWVDATGLWANPGPNEVARIRSVRFSVIIRSTNREPAKDESGTCITTRTAPPPWSDAAPLDLSADPDWRCYRYQVYASTVPLKNVVWGMAQ